MIYGLTHNYYLLLAVGSLTGLALGLAFPLTMVMVADVAPDGQRSQALALRLMYNYVGQTLSPILFGFLAARMGLSPVFWLSGGLLVFCTSLTGGIFSTSENFKKVNSTADTEITDRQQNKHVN